MKVLIVDYSAQFRRMISERLHPHFPGVQIEEAEHNSATAHACAIFKPDLLIIDIDTPPLNGMQTIVELKIAYPLMRIIVLSAFYSSEQRKLCLEAGADELLSKGAPLPNLLTAIQHAWAEGPTLGALHHKRGRNELITGLFSYDQPEHLEHLIVLRMNQVRREEILTTYDALLRELWQSMLPLLGRVLLLTLIRRTFNLTRQQYPFIAEIAVTRDGFNLCTLADHVEQIEPDRVRAGLQALMSNFIVILGQLTGHCLVRQFIHQSEVHALSA